MSKFEVRFRGEDERQLSSWRPGNVQTFGCSEGQARVRFGQLVKAGLDREPVDGVIPYAVEICSIKYKWKGSKCAAQRDTMLFQIAEPNAVQEGPWADNSGVDLTNELSTLFASDDNDEQPEPVSMPQAA